MLGLGKIAKKVFGTANERTVRKYMKTVDAINALESEFEKLSDEQISANTAAYRERLKDGETLEGILPEAFANVREAAKRTLGQRHYDVQLVGGLVLHNGSIAEMRTGEGKTLVATLAVYLNAIEGKGVHVVTVNDYLATRDSAWMSKVYDFLGLTTGVVIPSIDEDARRDAYKCDITYATNNELGFDYLRDNMKFSLGDMVQREYNFAVVDEVDSILVDEARTPLVISGPTEDKSDLYVSIDAVIQTLSEDDYEMDEKARNITLTEDGTENVEKLLVEAGLMAGGNLYDYDNTAVVHHVNVALKAQKLFEAEKDYIVKDDKVMIIDEFTGRMMEGRRFSDGLHQALEAKEGVEIQAENQTLASVTFQNYFRMYPKLSGMTGTAATEAHEFGDIYALEVVEIPTNVPVQRIDEHDEFYRTADEKYAALVEEIKDAQKRGQPVLVGTVSIEKSEHLSEIFKKNKIKHNVLNARYHEQEASIIAQAGHSSAVTLATNMAGRGTDIQLGGNFDMRIADETEGVEDEKKRDKIIEKITADIAEDRRKVIEAGGLYVIATERHESRRIDNQLRGRSGRQGDPGRSKFYLSLQDDLMRIFGPERMDSMLVRLGIEDGEAIIHPWINKAIEKAQQKVEARNYDIRKNLLKFDNVMNDQRSAIYEQRKEIMAAEDVSDAILDMRAEVVEDMVTSHVPPKSYPDQWDVEGLAVSVRSVFGLDLPIEGWAKEDGVDEVLLEERIMSAVANHMGAKEQRYGPTVWRRVEKDLLLQVLDQDWKEHLSQLDQLRQTIHLRAYGQRDPLNEYKTEAFSMFEALLVRVRETVNQLLAHVEFETQDIQGGLPHEDPQGREQHINPLTGENEMVSDSTQAVLSSARSAQAQQVTNVFSGEDEAIDPQNPDTWGKVPRNSMCPCGSGKKFKHCHGRI